MPTIINFFFLIFLCNISKAQTTGFQELNDKLFCNAFTYGKADSATNNFLKENFPYLAKPRPEGQILAVPIGKDAEEGFVTMKFQKHPFFNFNITYGKLDVLTIQNPGSTKMADGADIYLFFSNAQAADSAFNELLKLYKTYAVSQKITTQNGMTTAKFIGPKQEYYTPKALLKLSADETGECKIYFRNWGIDN